MGNYKGAEGGEHRAWEKGGALENFEW